MIIKAIFVVLQKVLDFVGFALQFVINLFPPSPFIFMENGSYSSLISDINYFIPIAECITILEIYLISVSIYYIYSVFARWVKLID